MEVAINAAMSEHIYSFNNKLRIQSSGGAIGNVLTGALATLYMLYWTRTFVEKVENATKNLPDFALYMMKVYVDDGNLASEILPPGSRLVSDEVKIVEDQIDADKDIPGDVRTANVLVEIGNSISSFINLTKDTPSQNESGWMPLLDLQVQVRDGNQIYYKFYKKKVSNPLLMLQSSAMPEKVKRATLTEEGIRRLRNTKRELPWEEKAEILSEFSHKLMLSGYSQKFRSETIKSAVAGYNKQLARADAGIRPLHRPRDWNADERRKKKLLSRTSWYRPHDSVIFVPATPGAELARRIQAVLDRDMARIGKRIRVVETGIKLEDVLV